MRHAKLISNNMKQEYRYLYHSFVCGCEILKKNKQNTLFAVVMPSTEPMWVAGRILIRQVCHAVTQTYL